MCAHLPANEKRCFVQSQLLCAESRKLRSDGYIDVHICAYYSCRSSMTFIVT
jgi:hypothetical protein